jgi:ABC-type nitrate/sulfonate/bicarbonate transport system ATPase subunit
MRQRAQTACALSMRPDIFLFDQPSGTLDAFTGAHLHDSLMEIKVRLEITVIMINH